MGAEPQTKNGAERIVLTTGAQHALLIALAATAKPGDTVLAEELTYSGMKDLSNQMHLKLRGVAMDGEGLMRRPQIGRSKIGNGWNADVVRDCS